MLAIAAVMFLLALMLSLYLDTTEGYDALRYVVDALAGGAGVAAILLIMGQLCPMTLRFLIEYAIAHPWHG